MTRTHRPLFLLLLLSGIFAVQTGIVCAQKPPTLSKRPADKPAAASVGPKTGLPTEDTVNSFLFQMFGYDASISWKILEIRPSEIEGMASVSLLISGPQGSTPNRLLVTSDGKHALSGDILPFGAKPFEDARVKLEKGVNGISKGPAKAAVLIVEFSDMQCPHCAKAAPGIEQLLAQEPEARFVFQNFPLPSHSWAEKAADYVDCVGRASNDAAWKFIQKTFEDQANITESNVDEKLKTIATSRA